MASSRRMAGRRGCLAAACDRCPPRVLTALSVAFFALTGLALRVAIYLLLHRLDFGVTTSQPAEQQASDVLSHHCRLKSGGAGFFVQNAVGCVIMAVVARHKKLMNEHIAAGLGSGLCGSLTTFATWMGMEAATFNNGRVFHAFVSLLCMLCVSLCSYQFGHYLAGCGMGEEVLCPDWGCCVLQPKGAPPGPAESSDSDASTDEEDGSSDADGLAGADGGGPARDEAAPVDSLDWGLAADRPESWREPEPPTELRLSLLMHWLIFVACAVIVGLYVGLCVGIGYTAGLLDLAMAPVGALLRWWLSLFNPLTAPFPLFTLVANILACGANGTAGVFVERLAAESLGDSVGSEAISAVSTGFAGCLSTVSTLVAELRSDTLGGLRLRTFYFVLSVGLAMAVLMPVDTLGC